MQSNREGKEREKERGEWTADGTRVKEKRKVKSEGWRIEAAAFSDFTRFSKAALFLPSGTEKSCNTLRVSYSLFFSRNFPLIDRDFAIPIFAASRTVRSPRRSL